MVRDILIHRAIYREKEREGESARTGTDHIFRFLNFSPKSPEIGRHGSPEMGILFSECGPQFPKKVFLLRIMYPLTRMATRFKGGHLFILRDRA